MATKTLTITEDAYNRLALEKRTGESFSDVVNRLTSRDSIRKLVGILTEEEADELEKNIKDLRERIDKEVDERTRDMFDS